MIKGSVETGYAAGVLRFVNDNGVILEVPAEYYGKTYQVIEHHGDIFALPPNDGPHLSFARRTTIAVKTRVIYPRSGAIARTKG